MAADSSSSSPTKTTTSFLNSPRSRLPFMVLDLQNAPPRSCTKVTFHQQCYKLVPDLTPDENHSFSPGCHSATPSANNSRNQADAQMNNGHSTNFTANTTTNHQKPITPTNPSEPRRRRLLPQIPPGKKPLEKLWQKSINASSADSLSLSEEIANCSHPMTSTPNRGAAGVKQPPLRLIRKLSSKMLLEIETDPESGKALSLRLITDDDSGINCTDSNCNSTTSEGKELGQMSSPALDDEIAGCTANHICTSQQHHHSFASTHNFSSPATMQTEKAASFRRGNITNASDSGLSSSLQSPTTVSSSNSVSIDYQCCYSVPTESQKQEGQGNSPQAASAVRPAVLKMPEATHRALYKFCARHEDELELQIGDAVHVLTEHDDHWSEGINLRTGLQGIFPASLVTDLEYSQFTVDAASLSTTGCSLFASSANQQQQLPPSLNFRIKRERYLLDFLGSIEVTECKGEEVLNEAISRVSATVMLKSEGTASGDKDDAASGNLMMSTPCQCILEISDIGLRMMDGCSSRRGSNCRSRLNLSGSSKTSEQPKNSAQHIDYFFSLMQITFCGYKLKSDVYFFAFITRHPADKGRYAAHVFRAPESTREVAEAVGQAFHRFYNHFVEVSLPLETFYLDD